MSVDDPIFGKEDKVCVGRGESPCGDSGEAISPCPPSPILPRRELKPSLSPSPQNPISSHFGKDPSVVVLFVTHLILDCPGQQLLSCGDMGHFV